MTAHSEKKFRVRLLRISPTLTAMSLVLAVAGCSLLPEMPEMPEMPDMDEMMEDMPDMDKMMEGL